MAEQVVARYAAGESGPAIAEALGVTPWQVYRLLSDRGVLRSHSEASRLRERGRARPDPAGDIKEILPVGAGGAGGGALRGQRIAEADRPRAGCVGESRVPGAKGVGGAAVSQRGSDRGPPPAPGGWGAGRGERRAGRGGGRGGRAVCGRGVGQAIAEALGFTWWRVYGLLRERGVLRTINEARQVREKRRAAA